MKPSWLILTVLTLVCAAVLVPIRTTPPPLLAEAHGIDWKCSRSAVVVVTCEPIHVVRLTSKQ
jgi:hypothetical protein